MLDKAEKVPQPKMGPTGGSSLRSGTEINQDQAAYWNSELGRKWVDHEAALDTSFQPVLDLVLNRAALKAGERVLDIGCGTGASTLAAAALVGATGMVEGLDISTPLLARARERAIGVAAARFTVADAQTHGFVASGYDALISRFGVMFFANSSAAFANLGRSIRPGGRAVFASWAGLAGNPWFSIGIRAAVGRLGKPAPLLPGAPGPMAFQDIGQVQGWLEAAGWADVVGEEVAVPLTPPGTLTEAAHLIGGFGPAVRILAELRGTQADAASIVEAVADALAEYAGPDGVKVPASINLFSAVRR